MLIENVKEKLTKAESTLKDNLLVHYEKFAVNEKQLSVYLTQKLMKEARKSKVWKGKEFCITLRNVKYGLDPEQVKSRGGRDGIFLLDKAFRPYNEMQRRIFDRFIDNPNSDYVAITDELNIDSDQIVAVRVVSHHMRIVGIYHRGENEDVLVLVDVDTKH